MVGIAESLLVEFDGLEYVPIAPGRSTPVGNHFDQVIPGHTVKAIRIVFWMM
jgi:hypothetical protein